MGPQSDAAGASYRNMASQKAMEGLIQHSARLTAASTRRAGWIPIAKGTIKRGQDCRSAHLMGLRCLPGGLKSVVGDRGDSALIGFAFANNLAGKQSSEIWWPAPKYTIRQCNKLAPRIPPMSQTREKTLTRSDL